MKTNGSETYAEQLAALRQERESLRVNLASGLCSPELRAAFERRLAELDEGLEAFDEKEGL